MTSGELRRVTRFARWHLAYIALVSAFFFTVYASGAFRSTFFLEEKFIFLALAPASTFVFILICPWRGRWKDALKSAYVRLEGQEIFCILGAFVMLFGYFAYSILIWGLGALVPSIIYM
jgi:hypothetical protein